VIPAVTVRMQDSRGLKVGLKGQPLMEFKERAYEQMGNPWPPSPAIAAS
jgi:hypothetical protein